MDTFERLSTRRERSPLLAASPCSFIMCYSILLENDAQKLSLISSKPEESSPEFTRNYFLEPEQNRIPPSCQYNSQSFKDMLFLALNQTFTVSQAHVLPREFQSPFFTLHQSSDSSFPTLKEVIERRESKLRESVPSYQGGSVQFIGPPSSSPKRDPYLLSNIYDEMYSYMSDEDFTFPEVPQGSDFRAMIDSVQGNYVNQDLKDEVDGINFPLPSKSERRRIHKQRRKARDKLKKKYDIQLEAFRRPTPIQDEPPPFESVSNNDSIKVFPGTQVPFLSDNNRSGRPSSPPPTSPLRIKKLGTSTVFSRIMDLKKLEKQEEEIQPEVNPLTQFFSNFSSKKFETPSVDEVKRVLTKGYLAKKLFVGNSDLDRFMAKHEDFLDYVQSSLCLCWQLAHYRNSGDIYTALYNYLSVYDVSFLDKTFCAGGLSTLLYLLNKSKTCLYDVELETSSNVPAPITSRLGTITGFLNTVCDSSAIEAFKTILLAAAAIKMLPGDLGKHIHRFIGKSTSMTVLELLRGLMNAIMRVLRIGELLLGGVPFSEALCSTDPLQTKIDEMKRLLLFKDRTYTGLPVEGWMDQQSFIRDAQEALTFFGVSLKNMTPASKHFKEVNSLFLELTDTILTKQSEQMARGRPTPIGVLLHGHPGIGKSAVIDFIYRIMSDVKKRPHKQTFIYERNTTSQYWEGYRPLEMPYIHYSEAGSTAAAIIKAQGDPIVGELCSVIDSLSRTADMAFADKGKIFFLPELVAIDTNNEDLHLDYAVDNPAAVRRRFIYVHLTVKPEYQEGGGSQAIDPSKCPDDGEFLNRWHFTVYLQKPLGKRRSNRVPLLEQGDVHAFTDLMTLLFSKHISAQDSFLKKRENIDVTKYGARRPKPPTYEEFMVKDLPKNPGLMPYVDEIVSVIHDPILSDSSTPLLSEKLPTVSISSNAVQVSRDEGFYKPLSEGPNSPVSLRNNNASNVQIPDSLLSSTQVADRINQGYIVPDEGSDIPCIPYDIFGGGVSLELDVLPNTSPLLIRQNAEIEDGCLAPPLLDVNSLEPIPESFKTEAYTFVTAPFRAVYWYFITVWWFVSRIWWWFSYTSGMIFRSCVFAWVHLLGDVGTCSYSACKYGLLSIVLYLHPYLRPKPRWYTFKFIWVHFIIGMLSLALANKWIMILSLPFFINPAWVCNNVEVKVLNRSVQSAKARMIKSADSITGKTGISDVSYATVNAYLGSEHYLMTCAMVGFLTCALGEAYFCYKDYKVIKQSMEPRKVTVEVPPDGGVTINRFGKDTEFEVFDPKTCVKVLKYRFDDGPEKSLVLKEEDLGWMKKLDPTGESSEFTLPSDSNERLNDWEKSCHTGKSIKKLKLETHADWFNVQQNQETCVFQGLIEGLAPGIAKNIRRACVKTKGFTFNTYIYGVKGEFALINYHAIGDLSEDAMIYVSCTGLKPELETVTKECLVSRSHAVPVGDDLVLIHLSGVQFGDILKHFSPNDKIPIWSDGYIYDQKVKVQLFTQTLEYEDSFVGKKEFKKTLMYTWPDHSKGLCGLPLLIQKDAGWCIGGIHSIGDKKSSLAWSVPISQPALNAAFEHFKTEFQLDSECDLQFPVEDPIKKSAFRFEYLPRLDYYGKVPGPVMANDKSRLIRSHAAPTIGSIFREVLDFRPTQLFAPPMMMPRKATEDSPYCSPYNNGLVKMNNQNAALDRVLLKRIRKSLVQHFLKGLAKEGITSLNPLDILVAVNGDPQDPFLRRITPTTAAGFGFGGKKSTYLPIVKDSDGEVIREPTDILKKRLEIISETYSKGKAMGFVYKAALKDEPRELSKCKSGNTRLFYVSPLDALVVARMYLGPFYTLMVQFGHIFHTAIGVDMHRDSDRIYREMSAFSQNIMEGDYSKYDLNMPFDIGKTACAVIHDVLKALGYNEEAMKMVDGILTDSMYVYVCLLSDIFCLPGLQPSGKYATAEDNSLRGLILLMYAWYSHPKLRNKDFFKYVKPLVYGDDLLAAVKDEVKDHFNGIYYGRFCRDFYRMNFTTAQKGDVLVPFENPDTMSFLKRVFRYKKDLDMYVGRLDMNSIFKTFYWTIPSKVVNPDEQALSVLQANMLELFFHLEEEQYTEMRKRLCELYADHFRVPVNDVYLHVLTYAETLNRFKPEPEPESLKFVEEKDFIIQLESIRSNSADDRVMHHDEKALSHAEFCATMLENFSSTRLVCLELLATLEDKLSQQIDPAPGLTYHDVIHSSNYHLSPAFRLSVDKYYEAYSKVENVKLTIARLNRAIAKGTRAQSESDSIGASDQGTIGAEVKEIHENVQDVGGETTFNASTLQSYKFEQIPRPLLTLNEWLARPNLMAEFVLPIGEPLNYSLDIWKAFFLEPSVRAKLLNFAFIRCDLNVRVAVSGTPFHYGMLQLSYIPQAKLNSPTVDYLSNPTLRDRFTFFLSQTKGSTRMSVRDNRPVDMNIPYVNFKPMIRLFNDSTVTLGTTTPYDDTSYMGTLFLYSLNSLQSVSPSPSSVSVMIYAWATNVDLICPTGTSVAIQTESDERKTGPITQGASYLSDMFAPVSNVPVIGKYAEASSMALKGMSNAAALLGWSYPVSTQFASRVKPEPFQNEALLQGLDTGKRMSFMPDQQLAATSHYTGSNEDELSLAFICSRNSLLMQISWAHSDEQLTSIWNCAVMPTVAAPIVGSRTFIQPSALFFAAIAFNYWRGDIIYEFEFVTSAFHRGKIAVSFDPNIAQYVTILSGQQLNKQYMFIMDIQESQNFSICVKWHHAREWAAVAPVANGITSMGNTIVNPTALNDYANGFISLFPINRVQSPDDSDVPINIYVRSENMMLSCADYAQLPTNRRYNIDLEAEATENESCITLNPSGASVARICQDHFGELVMSFRPLLKRFFTNDVYEADADTTAVWGVLLLGVFRRIPPIWPSNSGEIPVARNLLGYLRPAYNAMRGGFRHRFRFVGFDTTSTNGAFVNLPTFNFGSDPSYSLSQFDDDTFVRSFVASVGFVPSTNGGIEVEVPDYQNNYYYTAGNYGTIGDIDSNFCSLRMRSVQVYAEVKPGFAGGKVVQEMATADDFQLFGWIAAPAFTITNL